MQRFVVASSLIICFVFFGFGQSGRKIQPTPTPISQAVENDEKEYSESKPNTSRSLNRFPNLRNDNQTISKTESKNLESIARDGADIVNDDDVLKIETNLVTIPVSVFDRNGLYIPNLKQDEFQIFENGKEENIAYFATTEKPITVVLLLDTSPSTQYKIEEIQNAAIAFVNQLKAQDTVMVIEFDANIHVLTEPTTDRKKIYKAIWKADFGGGTSLYDAVDFSLRKRLNKIEGRKAIVLFTDGVDTTSRKSNYDLSMREAEESDSIIFPIYYNTYFNSRQRSGGINSPFPFPGGGVLNQRGTSASDYALGRKYLDDLADSTGGRVFRPESTAVGLTEAFKSIAEELRRQYSIGYYPSNVGREGQRKQIKIRVNRPNLVIRARDSYIVGRKNTDSVQKQ